MANRFRVARWITGTTSMTNRNVNVKRASLAFATKLVLTALLLNSLSVFIMAIAPMAKLSRETVNFKVVLGTANGGYKHKNNRANPPHLLRKSR